ncbi:aspartyl-phosphate phosphatase Spo0E family protein [Cohnella sp. AR92]|uniref:aspartyl-phosphate phosphatase Spo0E family protein n=1 Tax=Cohnella sp. AR92 TaxID=648716 RepID=UPI000F8D0160|nr:aspartyl-phosphate phosphatase Spo0E family protein [Cohnella sp. AR92]
MERIFFITQEGAGVMSHSSNCQKRELEDQIEQARHELHVLGQNAEYAFQSNELQLKSDELDQLVIRYYNLRASLTRRAGEQNIQ